MGLIANMAAKKGERAGAKLPVPTTAGDDQVIAAKTGEYVLPPEVVKMIGVDKLDAMVKQMTGQAPGGQPVEGMAMRGHALGGMVSKFDGVQIDDDPLQDNRESLGRYGFSGGMGADSVATEISRAAKGMPAADEVLDMGMDAMANKQAASLAQQAAGQRKRLDLNGVLGLERLGALGEDSNILGYNKGGLISRMQGYAEGGLIEDDPLRRRLNAYNPNASVRQPMAGRPAPVDPNELRNFNPQSTIRQPAPAAPAPDVQNLRNFNPQASIPPNASTNASPRAPELRTFTPEAGRVQPGSAGPRISGIAPPPSAPSATPVSSQGIADRVARSAAPKVGATPAGMAPTPAASGINYDIPPGQRARVGTATAADFEAAKAAASGQAAPSTNAPPQAAAKPGLAERAGRVAGKTVGRIGSLAKAATPWALNVGVNQSFADMDTGYRDEFNRSVGAESTMGAAAADTARTFANIGDAVTLGLAGRVGRGIAAATGGGSFGEGFASDSDRDRFLASKQSQQVAQAPQMTDQERQAEIAKRRAALEPPAQAAPTATQSPATPPTQVTAPQRIPRTGAAKTGKPLVQAAQPPAAPAIDPAVMADAQAAQAELDQSPIARIVGGTGGAMTIQYKDGTTKQVGQEGMDEVNGFYGLTSRAGQQYAPEPVTVIAGHNRTMAVPELGYQEVPAEVARGGLISDYTQGRAQGAIDRSNPLAAEARNRLAEIAAQGDNSIRVSNAAPDRDAAGRGLRNEAARLELDLTKKAMAGDAQAIAQLNMLRGKNGGGAQDEYVATTREVPVDPANPMLGTVKEPVIFNKRTGLPVQGGTVQSSSAAPQSAVAALRKDPKLAAQFDAKYGQGASAQYLNAR